MHSTTRSATSNASACASSYRRADVLPVDLHIRGCPPRPRELLNGLLAVLDKKTAG